MENRKRNILLTVGDIERIRLLTKQKATQFSAAVADSVPYERKMRKIGGRCMFLQGGSCSIYESRPLICRFYPFYLRCSEDGEFRIGFDSACSGIGKGVVRDEEFFRNLVKLAEGELADR